MTLIKTLMLALVGALALGIGGAMADGESAGGADVNSQPAYMLHHYVTITTERSVSAYQR